MPFHREKKEALQFTFFMSLAAILGKAASIPSGIITAKHLGTTGLGTLAIINLIIQYAGYTHFGLLQSLSREIPLAQGRGDLQEAKSVGDVVFTSFSITTAITACVLWILYAMGITFQGVLTPLILILISCQIIFSRMDSFLRGYVKGEGQLSLVGRADLISRIAIPCLTIPLVILLSIKGAILALILSELAVLIFYFFVLKPRFRWDVNLKKTLALSKSGFSIQINSLAENLFWSVDLVIISVFMAHEQVGLYSYALVAINLAAPFIGSIDMVVLRKMLVATGKHGYASKDIYKRYTEGALISYLFLTSSVTGLGVLLYLLIIRTFLSDYLASIPIMIILSSGYIVYSARYFLISYLTATNQLQKRFIILLTGLAANALFDVIVIKSGYGLKGVAVVCSVSFVLITSQLVFLSFSQIYGSLKPGCFFISKIVGISAALMGVLFCADRWFLLPYRAGTARNIAIGLVDSGLKAVIYLSVCFLLYRILFWKHDPMNEIKPFVEHLKKSFGGSSKLGKSQLRRHNVCRSLLL